MAGVAVGCPVSKKESVRDTAVSRGKARVEVSFEGHMYSKLRRPLYRDVGNVAADGIQWCSYKQA